MCSLLDLLKAVTVRLVLILHSLLVVWMVSRESGRVYWALSLGNFLLLLEGGYTVLRRKGQEWKWFSPCFAIYLLNVLPGIWLLELKKKTEVGVVAPQNSSNCGKEEANATLISGDVGLMVLEELLPYVMLIGRWILPRGALTRQELSQLLFVYVAIASDIMEVFALFEEKAVTSRSWLTIAVLGAWSLSILQFTVVFTAISNIRRSKPVGRQGNRRAATPALCCRSEVWSLLLSICMQDIPFVTIRIYAMVAYGLLTYSLVFFTSKNSITILLVIYRIAVVILTKKPNEVAPEGAETI